MYKPTTAYSDAPLASRCLLLAALAAAVTVQGPRLAEAQIIASSQSVIQKISSPNEKLELTTNTSRILTLEKRIPRVQVNNPELLSVTPLSATQVQISAKKAGVTAINLWDEDGQIHAVDVFIYGDVRELEHALKTQFPNSSIRVYRYSNALVLTGFIDRPDYVTPIVDLAQDYSPKVINNISVGGVQQVLLKVKVFEVSRTKLRQLGTDFSLLSSSGGFFTSGVSGLISNTTNGAPGAIQTIADSGGQTVEFGIVNGTEQFFGLLDALQENSLAKILAEPNIVAVSGRPAQFNEGGEIPILIPQGLGQISIEYKSFGTQVDFLPIVLGNGNIRLEVRPRVSDLDDSNSVNIDNISVPALTVREVDTAVEMKAGQTFALAGLIQRRTESVNRGLPYLSDVPVLGVPFRRVQEEVNEIELLILVTPEFVDALEPHEVQPCYPGAGTMSPDNCELYFGGHIEVPNRCNQCAQCECVPTHGHEPCCPGQPLGVDRVKGHYSGHAYDGAVHGPGDYGQPMMAPGAYPAGVDSEAVGPVPTGPALPGATVAEPISVEVTPRGASPGPTAPRPGPAITPQQQHGELHMPSAPMGLTPGGAAGRGTARPQTQGPTVGGPAFGAASPATAARNYTASRRPTYQRHASRPYSRPAVPAGRPPAGPEGLIGPVGYDAD